MSLPRGESTTVVEHFLPAIEARFTQIEGLIQGLQDDPGQQSPERPATSPNTVVPGPAPFLDSEPPSWPPTSIAPASIHTIPPSQDVPVSSPPSSIARYGKPQEVVDYILWNLEEGDNGLEDQRSMLISDQVSTIQSHVWRSLRKSKTHAKYRMVESAGVHW